MRSSASVAVHPHAPYPADQSRLFLAVVKLCEQPGLISEAKHEVKGRQRLQLSGGWPAHLQASGEQEPRAGRHGPLPQQHASQEDNAVEGEALTCFALHCQGTQSGEAKL